MTKPSEWIVGGDDVLCRWQVVRYMGRDSVFECQLDRHGLVKLFHDKAKARKLADQLNRSSRRSGEQQ